MTVTEGEDQASNMFAQQAALAQRNAAYNAYAKVYGPGTANAAAQDPTIAASLIDASQPHLNNTDLQAKVQQAQAGTDLTKAQTTEAQTANQGQQGYRAAQILASMHDPKDPDTNGKLFDSVVGAHATQYGIDPSMLPALRTKYVGAGGGDTMTNLAQMLLGPGKVTGVPMTGHDENGDFVIQTTSTGQERKIYTGGSNALTKVTGNESQQENATTNKAKLPILQQNANTAAFSANTRANNATYGNPNGFAGSSSNGTATPPLGAHAPNADGTATTPQFDKMAPVGSKARAAAIGTATGIVNADTMIQNFNNVAAQVAQQIPAGAGAGTLLKDLPASVQHNLEANLLTMKSGELTAWVASMKNASGQTGMGRILLPEVNAAMSAFGNMDQGQTVGQLQYHLKIAQQAINQLHATASSAFKAQWGQDPYALVGQTPGQGGSGTANQPASAPPKITSNAQWKSIKSGTQYTAPDGTVRTKQ